jgi:hypothetical protein
MFFDCPSVTALWNRLAKMLHELLGPRLLLKKLMLCGYSTLFSTPQQLANYLLILAKTTICRTYLATNSTHRHTPVYQRMFRARLQYRLHTELHYSLWNDIRQLQRLMNILGKIHDGKIMYVCVRVGLISPCTATHSGLLCFPFFGYPLNSPALRM